MVLFKSNYFQKGQKIKKKIFFKDHFVVIFFKFLREHIKQTSEKNFLENGKYIAFIAQVQKLFEFSFLSCCY